MKPLDDDSLERSVVVANCRMNPERGLVGSNGYDRQLGVDLTNFLISQAAAVVRSLEAIGPVSQRKHRSGLDGINGIVKQEQLYRRIQFRIILLIILTLGPPLLFEPLTPPACVIVPPTRHPRRWPSVPPPSKMQSPGVGRWRCPRP